MNQKWIADQLAWAREASDKEAAMTCACDPAFYCACLSGTCRCMPGACECSARERSIAQRGADAPLRPSIAQVPRHELGGLFGDEHKQLDIMDLLKT